MIIRRVALDSSVFRGVKGEQLDALRARGFVLSLPLATLSEVWHRATKDDKPGIVFGALRKVLPRLDEHEPFVLTGGHQAHSHDAPPHVVKHFSGEYRQRGRLVRAELLRALDDGMQPDQFAVFARALKDFDRWADRFKETLDVIWNTRSTIDPALPEREAVAEIAGSWKRRLKLGWGPRFDATLRVLALKNIRAYRGQGRRPTSNDYEDFQMLDVVSTPAFLAIEDRNLLADVRACGTYQAPWVRTVEDLVCGALPSGMPWGPSAERECRRFIVASRSP